MSTWTEVQHAKRHAKECNDAWESGFFLGAAFALEERLYDQYQKNLNEFSKVLNTNYAEL